MGVLPGIGESFVAMMDKGTGMPAQKYPLSPLPGTVRAWAFAHWGGRYYIFVTVFDPMLRTQQLPDFDVYA